MSNKVNEKLLQANLFNPHKYLNLKEAAANSHEKPARQEEHRISRQTSDSAAGKLGKDIGNIIQKKVSTSVHRHTTSENVGEEKKAFTFQLDPKFRMDLIQKRMNSKLNIKDVATEVAAFQNAKASNPGSFVHNFCHMKKQSLDVVNLAEEKEQQDKKLKFAAATEGKGKEMLDQMVNKQTLIGLIDQQKSQNLSKLGQERLSTSTQIDLSVLNNKSLATTMAGMQNQKAQAPATTTQLLNMNARRAPINVNREIMGTMGGPSKVDLKEGQSGDKKASNGFDKVMPLSSTNQAGGSSYLYGGIKKLFTRPQSVGLTGTGSGHFSTYDLDNRGPNLLTRQRSASREVSEVKTQTYYMTPLKYNYRKKLMGPISIAFKEHFLQSVGALKYASTKGIDLYQYKDVELVKGKLKRRSDYVEPKAIPGVSTTGNSF